MKQIIGNPYVRIALGAIASTYLSPKIINKFVRPELVPMDATINDVTSIGITASVTTTVFVLLGMLGGKSAGTAAAPNPGTAGAGA